jgi:serine/threonine protein kinase
VNTARGDFKGTKRFNILRCIGRGGMGEVYEAFDRDHNTRVALKLLTSLSSKALLRFKNEFRALRDIDHPNVVSFGELLEDEGRWFFTMEFVEGVDFLTYVRSEEEEDDGPTAPILIPATSQLTLDAPPPVQSPEQDQERVAPRFDESRLRRGLDQLVRGLSALHDAGKVHRDIKPSNIRVAPDGHVVLLDFGLVSDIDPSAIGVTDSDNIVGTPSFMAPEQAAMHDLGPEVDWYAVGVLLFLSLTGRLPFRGNAMEIMMSKQQVEPAPPSTLVRDLPRDLDQLCTDLLRLDPKQRPTGDEILRRIEAHAVAIPAADRTPLPIPQVTPFVGRTRELETLRESFERSRSGQVATVYVYGESGVGKSSLVRHFTEQMIAERNAVVLTGRCFETELVPFKGVDGLIDALSNFLMTLSPLEVASLLPAHAALMTQVFPVLQSVEAIAAAPPPLGDVRDAQELRSRAFAAVRELFTRLALRRPVILVIDDMQWGDADSLALLRDILRPPEQPAVMLLMTVRTSDDSPAQGELSAMPGALLHLHLEHLPPEESHELAVRVLQQYAIVDEKLSQAIADEAGGHPLFIDELARHARASGAVTGALPLESSRPSTSPAALGRLEEALWQRAQQFDARARRILEVLAVAGAPLTKEIAVHAVSMDFVEFAKRVSQLRVAHLLRGSDTGHADSIELYHDRIRRAVLSHLDVAQLTACDRRLALAHESAGDGDFEALAKHWRGAGEDNKAVGYALHAAEQAVRTLAFGRAAQLYGMALELGVPGEEHRVYLALGDAQRNAGRGAEAARAYLAAAQFTDSQAQKLEMQRRATEQLLMSGHLDEGLANLRVVLGAVGMKMPGTPRQALLSLVWNRVRLRLRGMSFRERDVSEVPAEELTRLDISWSASTGLSQIDPIVATDFQSQNVRQALDTGEPRRIACALAVEAGLSSVGAYTTEKRTNSLLQSCEALATRLDDIYAIGLHKMVGAIAAMLSGRFRRARGLGDEAEAIFRANCTGVAWELVTAQRWAVDGLIWGGEIRELQRRVPAKLAWAQERGDLFAVINFRTIPQCWCLLAQDKPDEVRREIKEAMASWSHSGVHVQHWYELLSLSYTEIYSGAGAAAYARILERAPVLGRAQIFRVLLLRAHCIDARGRAALAAAAASGNPKPLLQSAHRDARAVAAIKMPFCRPIAAVVRAGIAAVERDDARAVSELRAAAQGFDETDMNGHAAAARRQLGLLLKGDEGAALVAAADAALTAEGIARPDRFAYLLVPIVP